MLGELDKETSATVLRSLGRDRFVPSSNTFRANFARFTNSEELANLTSATAYGYTKVLNNVHWAVSAFKRMSGTMFNIKNMFVPPASSSSGD